MARKAEERIKYFEFMRMSIKNYRLVPIRQGVSWVGVQMLRPAPDLLSIIISGETKKDPTSLMLDGAAVMRCLASIPRFFP